MKKYKINEIFESIQGEGSMVGTLSVFVRFSGCNMNCDFCDTDFESYMEMTADEILKEVKKYKAEVLVFTGGEPMLQLDSDLINIFDKDYWIQVETNGSIDIFDHIDHITVSPKSPYSWRQKNGTDLKFLVSYKDADLLNQIYNDTIFENYFLQPIDGPDYKANLDRCIELIKIHPEWRLSLQIHKIIKVQ